MEADWLSAATRARDPFLLPADYTASFSRILKDKTNQSLHLMLCFLDLLQCLLATMNHGVFEKEKKSGNFLLKMWAFDVFNPTTH